MAKVSKEVLEARVKDAESQVHILQFGLHCSLNNEIEWIAKETTKDGARHKFGVARLDSPHGGLFFTRFDFSGQNPSFHVAYLDDVLSECKSNPSSEYSQIRIHALDKAVSMRYKIIESK